MTEDPIVVGLMRSRDALLADLQSEEECRDPLRSVMHGLTFAIDNISLEIFRHTSLLHQSVKEPK